MKGAKGAFGAPLSLACEGVLFAQFSRCNPPQFKTRTTSGAARLAGAEEGGGQQLVVRQLRVPIIRTCGTGWFLRRLPKTSNSSLKLILR